MRTAESGYLTRKLCDASQEVIVRGNDCGTEKYIHFSKEEAELQGENFFNLIRGRFLAEDIIDARKTIILSKGELLDRENMDLLEKT